MNISAVYNEVLALKKACGSAHLKTILATGELKTLINVYKASWASILAGNFFQNNFSDFFEHFSVLFLKSMYFSRFRLHQDLNRQGERERNFGSGLRHVHGDQEMAPAHWEEGWSLFSFLNFIQFSDKKMNFFQETTPYSSYQFRPSFSFLLIPSSFLLIQIK